MLSKLLANTSIGRGALGLLVLTSTSLTPVPAQAQERPRPRVLPGKAFMIRVNDYLALQKKLEVGLPPLAPTDQPTRTEVHSRGLADRIREARHAAKPGDIFGDTAPIIRNTIREDSERRTVRDAYAAMEEVPVQAPPAVNADYPEKTALATVPPLVLARLPQLPDGVEYRFMGRDLVLRDMKANIIVDIVREAIPTIAK